MQVRHSDMGKHKVYCSILSLNKANKKSRVKQDKQCKMVS